MKKNLIIAPLVALAISGCGIASSTKSGSVGADRNQLLIIPASQMQEGANASYAKVLADAKSKNALNVNPTQLKRVRAVANRLIPQVKVFRSDALNWDWKVNVIKSNQLNAWCMPGGKIAFYSGIIEKLKLTDDEIAAIMGHEISHALKEHSRERASEQMVKKLGFMAASKLGGVSDDKLKLANMVSKYTLELPFSRAHESEADKMGVELAARAGYNPRAAINVWKKMQKASSGQPMEFMSTHPSHATRIKELEKISKITTPLYLKAKNNK